MSWKAVRGCGKVKEFYKKIPLNTGKIKTGEFLFEVMEEFAKVSTRIFDTIGDLPYAYKERQLSSIFLPSFYNLGFGAIQETPTRRNDIGENEDGSVGWLDYWVQKDDKWVYLIEVKHGWQFFEGVFTEDIKKKIESSLGQLNRINGEELEKLSTVESTFKISLVVMPIYRNVPKDMDIALDDEFPTSLSEVDNLISGLNVAKPDSVSWIGVWTPPDRMQYAFERDSANCLGTYPGVLLVASIVVD